MTSHLRRTRFYVRPHGWVGADGRGGPARMIAWAQQAEELGVDGIFLGDRMLASATGPKGSVYGASMIEVTTMLAAIAASTDRIELGSLVYVFPYRHPVQIAKTTASLDVIADGRFILGAGIGWNRGEFEVLGIERPGRGDAFEEAVEIVRALWSGEPVDFSGERWHLDATQVTPRPVRPGGPPIWIASFSPDSALDWNGDLPQGAKRVLARIGRIADGWVPLVYSASSKRRISPEILGSAWRYVLEQAASNGRGREQIDFVYSDWCYVLDPPYGSRAACERALGTFFQGSWEDATSTYTIGTAQEVVEQIHAMTATIDRVDAFVLTPLEESEAQLRAFTEDVRPRLIPSS